MDLNDIIKKSLRIPLMEETQETSVKFGGSTNPGIEDKNVESKNQSSTEDGLKGDIDKKNKNPQGEGGKDAISPIELNPKLQMAVVAGIANAGIGAKIGSSDAPKFTPPAPAD